MASVGLGRDGWRFTYDGKPWFVSAIDCETLAADTRCDISKTLDLLVEHGFNKIRLWAHCWLGVWTGPQEAFLRPWKRVDGPDGKWSSVRWDLDRWDEAYWSRMKTFCAEAQRRDVVVEISIFAEWVRDFHEMHVRGTLSNQWWRSEIFRPAWNSNYNINGAFTTNADGDFWPEFIRLDHPEKSRSGKTLRDYQQAYIDKMVGELDGFANIYYEFFNEFPAHPWRDGAQPGIAEGQAWEKHWLKYLKGKSRRLIGAHAHQIGPCQRDNVGVEYFWDDPAVDVLNFHWYNDDPREIAWAARPLLPHGKVVTNNEGAWHGVTGPAWDDNAWAHRETRAAWGGFMAGAPYSMTEFPPDVGGSRWLKAAGRFAALRTIAESMRFWELSPIDGLGNGFDGLVGRGPTAHWRVMANPGREYLVYFWGDGAGDNAAVSLPEGEYECTWFDPRDGGELLRTTQPIGAFTTIASPAKPAWEPLAGLVLRIVAK